MKALSWINFILGVWLFIAGFTLAAGARPIMTEEIVLGIIIAVLSYWAAVSMPHAALSWIVALAGLWVLIAPTVIDYHMVRAARNNDFVIGIIVLVLGVVNAIYSLAPSRTHA